MAKVTGFTAQRMLEIEQASVVDAAIEGEDELIFYTRGGKRIRAGVIKGGTAEWIEEYKPIVDNSAEKVGELLQSYNDMSELFVEVDQNLVNLDQDLEDMHTRVETVSKNAMDALQNANAAAQTVSVEYAISQSHTVPPLSGWAKEQPAPQPGDVVWSRLVTTYGSGYIERSEPSPMTGWVGDDGIPGKDGVGLTKTDISYAKSSSGTVSPSSGWQTTVPAATPGQYLWTRTVWTYTDNTTETGYSVALWGTAGAKGEPGVAVTAITPFYKQVAVAAAIPAPEDLGWVTSEPEYVAGTALYRTELVEFSDGTSTYTPVSKVSAYQAAENSLYIANLAKELAEGLVDLSPSMPENPLPGQVWISQDEKKNMTGVWRFNGSEWQQSSILTGLIMVPGEDGQMTLIGPKGVDAPSVLADIIRTEVLYADVGGVKKFIVSDIPRENLEDGVKTALDTAESIGTRIVLDGSKGELIIARDKYRSGVSDTMTVLTASSMNFMFDGQAVTSINSATRQLTTVNAQVQGALRFPSHTIKTLPGTSILVFQQA